MFDAGPNSGDRFGPGATFKLRFMINSGQGINADNWVFDEIFVMSADFPIHVCQSPSEGSTCLNHPQIAGDNLYFGYSSPSNLLNANTASNTNDPSYPLIVYKILLVGMEMFLRFLMQP